MKRKLLIQHPEFFQGEDKLNKDTYFEGWYFKNSKGNSSISFIPGIHIENGEKKAFIQVITNSHSYYIPYSFSDFSFSHSPFSIRIKDNFFSKDNLSIHIQDEKQNLKIDGDIHYTNSENITTTKISPSIMGPFSYLPFMECNHGIISMKNDIAGTLVINEQPLILDEGIGYIEKDWGSSFPQSYVWCEGNNFKDSDASFFLSVATIPKPISFTGFICSFIWNKKEYRFASYNFSKLVRYEVSKENVSVLLKHKDYLLLVESNNTNGLKLKAPVKGEMNKDILETLNASIQVTLKKDNTVLFTNTSSNCGLEIVL